MHIQMYECICYTWSAVWAVGGGSRLGWRDTLVSKHPSPRERSGEAIPSRNEVEKIIGPRVTPWVIHEPPVARTPRRVSAHGAKPGATVTALRPFICIFFTCVYLFVTSAGPAATSPTRRNVFFITRGTAWDLARIHYACNAPWYVCAQEPDFRRWPHRTGKNRFISFILFSSPSVALGIDCRSSGCASRHRRTRQTRCTRDGDGAREWSRGRDRSATVSRAQRFVAVGRRRSLRRKSREQCSANRRNVSPSHRTRTKPSRPTVVPHTGSVPRARELSGRLGGGFRDTRNISHPSLRQQRSCFAASPPFDRFALKRSSTGGHVVHGTRAPDTALAFGRETAPRFRTAHNVSRSVRSVRTENRFRSEGFGRKLPRKRRTRWQKKNKN